MNEINVDTHGVAGTGWYGFDLDGTLAIYHEWQGIAHIGEPVKPMVDRIKKMHKEGKKVKILTARVAPRSNVDTSFNPYLAADGKPLDELPKHVEATFGDRPAEETMLQRATVKHEVYDKDVWTAREFIIDWCYKHLGFVPEITHEKDHLMLELYDDRVKQVVPNQGLLVEDQVAVVTVHPQVVRPFSKLEELALIVRVTLASIGLIVLFHMLLHLIVR